MNLLALDASTDCLSVGLATRGKMVSVERPMLRQHARMLLPIVERLLVENECGLEQLAGIVYGQGPGSFTGLRIACCVAKGLAYAYNLPLFPVSSLAALAQAAFQKEKKVAAKGGVLAMIDARMEQVYWAYFTTPFTQANAQVSNPQAIQLNLDAPLVVTGVGYEPYLARLPVALQKKIGQHFPSYPSAQAMLAFALEGKIAPVTAAGALPFYVRDQITQGEPRG